MSWCFDSVFLCLGILTTNQNAVPTDLATVAVRPLAAGLKLVPPPHGADPRRNAVLTLTAPINLSLEPWGVHHPLHIFANPLETDVPSPDAPGVMFFGPGVHFVDNPVRIPDDTTVYIAGGAVIKSNYDPGAPQDVERVYGYNYSTIPSTFECAC